MLSEDLLVELHKLNRAGKLRVVQLLVNELALQEEEHVLAGTQFEVWSPYDAPGAAQTLLGMLAQDEARRETTVGQS